MPNAYVVEPPPLGTRNIDAGGIVSFHLVLVGRAIDQLPLIAYALQRAFGHGIGRLRARGQLEDIAVERAEGLQTVWDRERQRLDPHEQTLTVPSLPYTDTLTLHIDTPLRLQNQGHPVSIAALRPRTLLTALLRRASLLLELHARLSGLAGDASRITAAAERLSDEKRLAWKDWMRFSSRQQQEMTLGVSSAVEAQRRPWRASAVAVARSAAARRQECDDGHGPLHA